METTVEQSHYLTEPEKHKVIYTPQNKRKKELYDFQVVKNPEYRYFEEETILLSELDNMLL